MKTRKLDLLKEKQVMDQIQRLNNRGEANFSSLTGDDDMYESDSFERSSLSDGYEDGEDGYEQYAAPQQRRSRPAGGKLNVPQRTISINIQNNIGVAGFSGKSAGLNPQAQVTLFGATQNGLPGVPGLGITKLNPTLGVVIDGTLYAGTANATDQDLIISSDTASYRQIFAESQSSPYQVYGNKLFCSTQAQLANTYQTVEVDLLGRNLTVPYTPFDKQSAYQFSTTIIEDPGFTLKLDGNMSIVYTIFSPGTSGVPSGTGNLVKMSIYLYKIVEANRALSGKGNVVTSRTKQMPTGTQQFKLIK